MFNKEDIVKGVCVKLKSAKEIRNWSGRGTIPCDVYGGRNVIVEEATGHLIRVFRDDPRIDSRYWSFPYSLIDSIVSDENEIMECKKKAGYMEYVCCVCGKKTFSKNHIFHYAVFCNDCAKTHEICPKCRKPILKTEMIAFHGRRICKDCFEKALETEEIVKDNEGKYAYAVDCIKIDGQWVNLRNVEGINDYHTMKDDGRYIFFNTPEEESTSPLYLGVELEVECSDEDVNLENDAKRVKLLLGKDFVQHEDDGSLDNGFENITHPATLAYHKQIADKYKIAFDFLRRNGYTSHQNGDCGLHIHFNRNFFGREEEERVSKLLYLTEKFWNEMVIFSRRSESQLNRWARRYDEAHDAVSKHLKDGYYGRYHAINLVNSKTIEFRLFRGTLNIETFFATLELVDRLVRLAKDSTIESLKTLTWDDVLNTDTLKNYYNRVVLRKQR